MSSVIDLEKKREELLLLSEIVELEKSLIDMERIEMEGKEVEFIAVNDEPFETDGYKIKKLISSLGAPIENSYNDDSVTAIIKDRIHELKTEGFKIKFESEPESIEKKIKRLTEKYSRLKKS
jgi:hypothetical protein